MYMDLHVVVVNITYEQLPLLYFTWGSGPPAN